MLAPNKYNNWSLKIKPKIRKIILIINVKDIPKGELHSYILLSMCFPELYIPNRDKNTDIINFLSDKGIETIITTEDLIDTSADNITLIKSRAYLDIEEYDIGTMKDQIKIGYLDTLKAINKLEGKIYYINIDEIGYRSFVEHLHIRFYDNRDSLVSTLFNKDVYDEINIQDEAKELLKKTKFSQEDDVILSLIENLAEILGIDEKEKYTFTSLKNKIKNTAYVGMNKSIKILNDTKKIERLLLRQRRDYLYVKEHFLDYFAVLTSIKEENYKDLSEVFEGFSVDLKLGIITLIYILY